MLTASLSARVIDVDECLSIFRLVAAGDECDLSPRIEQKLIASLVCPDKASFRSHTQGFVWKI